jgi:hypothetical protein
MIGMTRTVNDSYFISASDRDSLRRLFTQHASYNEKSVRVLQWLFGGGVYFFELVDDVSFFEVMDDV